ncbi:MAG: hypothetical protein HY909_25405 [Deltaproteobacteria bacterium]|nr:hypothetical protein [Deltaproteobacteria bacterium]
MARDRERKSWRDIDRSRESSVYRSDTVQKQSAPGRQTAAVKEYRAALEALFQKKPEAAETIEKIMPSVVLPRVVEPAGVGRAEPAGNRRQELLRRISAAQGSRPISDAVDAFLAAGHTLPEDQEVYLQVLEHRDEARVREALGGIEHLLAGQLPKRKPLLVQRLKRLEEHAEEAPTRDAAAQLRRRVG